MIYSIPFVIFTYCLLIAGPVESLESESIVFTWTSSSQSLLYQTQQEIMGYGGYVGPIEEHQINIPSQKSQMNIPDQIPSGEMKQGFTFRTPYWQDSRTGNLTHTPYKGEEQSTHHHYAFIPVPVFVWYAITGSTAVTILARTIVKVLKDYRYGGLILDLTGTQPKISESLSLDRGEILVVMPNGKIHIERKKTDSEMVEFVNTLISNATKLKEGKR